MKGRRCGQRQGRCRAAPFVYAHQAHGTVQVLGILKLDIDSDVIRKTTSEQLGLLEWCQVSGVSHACQECLQVGVDGGGER